MSNTKAKEKQENRTKEKAAKHTVADSLGIDKEKVDNKEEDVNGIFSQFQLLNYFKGEVAGLDDKIYKIRKLPWGKNLELINYLGNIVENFNKKEGSDLLDLNLANLTAKDMHTLYRFMLIETHDAVTKIVSIIMDMSEDDVKITFDEDAVLTVVMSFFGRKKVMGEALLTIIASPFLRGRATS